MQIHLSANQIFNAAAFFTVIKSDMM